MARTNSDARRSSLGLVVGSLAGVAAGVVARLLGGPWWLVAVAAVLGWLATWLVLRGVAWTPEPPRRAAVPAAPVRPAAWAAGSGVSSLLGRPVDSTSPIASAASVLPGAGVPAAATEPVVAAEAGVGSGRTFRVFVSSTFSDFAVERDALRRDVWPVLRRFCAARGARFQEVDLRWGVSEEAALDQQTMNICLGEIERCHQVTPRPNFLVLVGNRAGWMPPPPQIPAAEWDQILTALSESDRTFLGGWYVRDGNAVPAEYRLQPRAGEFEDAGVWAAVEARLQRVLASAVPGLGFDEARERPYLWSATGQEIAVGALEAARPRQVVAFLRTIDTATAGGGDPVADWVDPDQEPLDAVKSQLSRLLDPDADTDAPQDADGPMDAHGGEADESGVPLPERLIRETVGWGAGAPVLDEGYLARFTGRVLAALMAAIAEELDHPLPVPDEPGSDDPFLDAEGRAHVVFGLEKSRFFTGRSTELAAISGYVSSDDRRPLVVWGEGGTGKSALIATAAGQITAVLPGAVVVSRFVGATPASADGRALLASICAEVARRAGDTQAQIPTDFNELVTDFTTQLSKATADRPIVVIVDSLDQLAPGPARGLAWIPTELPEHARMVVSTRPGDTLTPLESSAVLLPLVGLPFPDGERLLDVWLADAGRTLQPPQRAHVLDAFNDSERNPLYLRLAFEEARRWVSGDGEPPEPLNVGLSNLIRNNLYARLSREDKHGAVLVAHTLGYLAASRNGLAEDELVDVLSRDIDVYSWFLHRSYHIPPDIQALDPDRRVALLHTDRRTDLQADPARLAELETFLAGVLARQDGPRLPAAVWSRLLADLQPYLTMRRAEGGDLLAFHHRELTDTAHTAYASEDTGRELHSRLADYFHAKADPNHDHTWTTGPGQTADVRGLAELPYHLTRAERWTELHATLTDFGFLERKTAHVATTTGADGQTAHNGVYALLDDFDDALHQASDTSGGQPMVLDVVDLGDGPQVRCPHCDATHPWPDQADPADFICPNPACGAHFFVRTAAVESVHGALQLSAPILVNDPYLLAGQLVGRLLGRTEPSIRYILDIVRPSNRRPWLCPTSLGSLTPPGGPREHILQGHTRLVETVMVTPDGQRIVSGSGDGTVRVWNLASGRLEHTLEGHADGIEVVAVSPDGRRIISGSGDKTVRVWNLASGRLERILEGHTDWVTAVAVTPDGQRIISGSWDKTVRVWDLASGRLEQTLEGHTTRVYAVAVTPDGQRVISGSGDATVRVWDLASGRLEQTLGGHTGGVSAVAVTPDGLRIVSGSFDETVRVWNLASGRLEHTLKGHTGRVSAVSVTPDGQWIISGSDYPDNAVRVWDMADGQLKHTLRGHTNTVEAVAISPDGLRIISGSRDNAVRVWDLATGLLEQTLEGHTGSVNAVAMTPDGLRIVSGSSDCTLRVWNLAGGHLEQTLEGHSSNVYAVTVTPDGRGIVSGSSDRTVRRWDLVSGHLQQTLKRHTDEVYAVAVTPDGRRIISGSFDETVRVWDLAAGRLEHTLEGHTLGVAAVAVTPDGRRIVSGSWDNTVRVWNLATARLEQTLKGHTGWVWAVAVTSDGRRIISGSMDRTVRVWDLAAGRLESTLEAHNSNVYAVTVTPDGRRIISGSEDHKVRVWDLTSGRLEHTLEGHSSTVLTVAVTPDGRRIISGSSDCTVRVWDLASGTELASWVTDANGIGCCAVSPRDSTTVVYGDHAGNVVVLTLREPERWKLPPQA